MDPNAQNPGMGQPAGGTPTTPAEPTMPTPPAPAEPTMPTPPMPAEPQTPVTEEPGTGTPTGTPPAAI